MRTSPPTRLPADVYESALASAGVDSRSVPQQIAHWARIGREFENSPQVNHRAIAQVLAGNGFYDLLGEREQAVVRGAWSERIATLRESLNLASEFMDAGDSYSEADENGTLMIHPGQ
ncbi:MAG: ParD-like family protein [Propionibacteriaceae bacterium]|nr:ParD-like family protein [Propionibacteriaceae bacterium]